MANGNKNRFDGGASWLGRALMAVGLGGAAFAALCCFAPFLVAGIVSARPRVHSERFDSDGSARDVPRARGPWPVSRAPEARALNVGW